MTSTITKQELCELIHKTTIQVMDKNHAILENQLDTTIEVAVNIASYVTFKILDELNIIKLD